MVKICVYYATGGYFCYNADRCPSSEGEIRDILNREGAENLDCVDE